MKKNRRRLTSGMYTANHEIWRGSVMVWDVVQYSFSTHIGNYFITLSVESTNRSTLLDFQQY